MPTTTQQTDDGGVKGKGAKVSAVDVGSDISDLCPRVPSISGVLTDDSVWNSSCLSGRSSFQPASVWPTLLWLQKLAEWLLLRALCLLGENWPLEAGGRGEP